MADNLADNLADNREALMFKKVPEGYVFRAPNRWVFGHARFYLVNEAERKKLLAIVTARSQWVFWIVLTVLIGVSTAGLAYGSGDANPTARDFVIMLVLLPAWLYAALLMSTRPTVRRLQPLLAGLPPTDRRITAADLRQAARKTISIPQYLMLGASQAIMAAALVMVALQKTGRGQVSLFDDGGALILAFAAVIFVMSSLAFLVAALDRARHPAAEPALAPRALMSVLLPVLCLVVSIALAGFVVVHAMENRERDHRAAQIQARLDDLRARLDGLNFQSRQQDIKTRAATNSARMSELVARLNDPIVKCDAATATDDPALAEGIRTCRELARREQDGVQRDMAATMADSKAIQQDGASLQREVGAIRGDIESLQGDIKAIRR
jgi:hypothetical protein